MAKAKGTNDGKSPAANKVIVQVQLEGDEADRFEAYKKRETINISSVAGRKLMLERLAQVESARPA